MSGRGATDLPRIEDKEFALPGAEEELEMAKIAEVPVSADEATTPEAAVAEATNGTTNGTTTGVSDGATTQQATAQLAATDPPTNLNTMQRKHQTAQEITELFLTSPEKSVRDKGRITLSRRRHVDTVIILNLPHALSDEKKLKDFFELELNLGPVEQVHIARRYTRLRKAIEERYKWLKNLEWAWTRYLGNPAEHFDLMTDEDVLAIMEYSAAKEAEGKGDSKEPAKEEEKVPTLKLEDFELKEVSTSSAAPAENGTASTVVAATASSTLATDQATVEAVLGQTDPSQETSYNPADFSKAFGRYIDSAYPCGPTRDALNYYFAKFKEADEKVRLLRDRIETSTMTSTAFVVFFSPESAVVATQTLLPSRPGLGYMRVLPSPSTRDLVWSNISSRWAAPSMKAFRTMIVFGILFLLVFFWSVPVSLLSSFLSLDSLANAFPNSIGVLVESMPPLLKDLIQGLIPSIILSIWMGILPIILYALCMFEGIEAFSWIDLSLFSKLFFYNIWNTLLIFAISGSIWNALDAIINNPSEIPQMLASALTGVSPFFMVYIFLNGFIMLPLRLLLPGYVYLSFLRRLFPDYKKMSPRKVTKLVVPVHSMNYKLGDALTTPMVIYVLTFFYSQIQPLILPAGFAYFVICYVVWKYIFLYLHFPLYDTRGTGYSQVGWAGMIMRRVMFASMIQILMMLGVLGAKGNWYIGVPVCVTVLALAIIVAFSMNSGLSSWEKFIPLRAANQARSRDDLILAQLKLGVSGIGSASKATADTTTGRRMATAEAVEPLLPAGTKSGKADLVVPASAEITEEATADTTAAAIDLAIAADAKEEPTIPVIMTKSTFPEATGDTGKDIGNFFKYLVTGSNGSGLLSDEAIRSYSDTVIDFVKPHLGKHEPEVPHELRTGQMTERGRIISKEKYDSFKYEYAIPMDLNKDGLADMDAEAADDAVFRPDRAGYTGYYLEPDSWRLKGVLDPIIPLKGGFDLKFGLPLLRNLLNQLLLLRLLCSLTGSFNVYRLAEEDPQNYIYSHPAVSGALPQLWLPSRKHTINISDVRKRYDIVKSDEEKRKSFEARVDKKEWKWLKGSPHWMQEVWSDFSSAWGAFGTSIAFTFR